MKSVYSLIVCCFILLFIYQCQFSQNEEIHLKTSGAGNSLDAWAMERNFPYKKIPAKKFYEAFEVKKQGASQRNNTPAWTAIGPKNIAGRTLCLAFHPTDKDLIFLGSASGGLWKTTTAGLGIEAWSRVLTGFPILGVGTIAINPENPDEIFIGTGEMYNSQESAPGIINRTTRGTYGIGILKSIDGGENWEKSLDWSYQNFTGVQDLIYHPQNSDIIYAATSEGLIRSSDKGGSWETIHDLPMAVDIEINPDNPDIIYVTHGSLYHSYSGIYRSKDGGESFDLLKSRLPQSYTGKTMISLDPNNPEIIYASVADAFESLGLFASTNGGDSWRKQNGEDIAKWQGWYSHDVAVNPYHSEQLVYVGIDAWLSNNSGSNFQAKGGTFEGLPKGKIPVGVPDGPPTYVHSDIHRVYFHPLVKDLVFLATDGGVFVSESGGIAYESRNGGLQTSQFYPNFSNSASDSLFAIGGLQDNNSAIYDGTDAWIRVLGGDGMSTAINPNNDQIVFGSSQVGWISRSVDKGFNFDLIKEGNNSGTFNSPLEMAPSAPNIIYTASSIIERSNDFGTNWERRDKVAINWGNAILTLAISPLNPAHIIFGTAPTKNQNIDIFISENGGVLSERVKGLPNRIVKDFAFHPKNDQIIYAVFSGYGTAHLYKTEDNGNTWSALGNNLPDLPHHSLLIDPEFPEHLYIGNDLGVYFSEDGGIHFEPMMKGLPEAIYAINLSYSAANRKIRLASHGNGVYEAPMIYQVPPSPDLNEDGFFFSIYPNPTQNIAEIQLSFNVETEVSLDIYDAKGALVQTVIQQEIRNGTNQIRTNLDFLPAGVYFFQLHVNIGLVDKKVITKRIVKQ